jgi:hypothetical protein
MPIDENDENDENEENGGETSSDIYKDMFSSMCSYVYEFILFKTLLVLLFMLIQIIGLLMKF